MATTALLTGASPLKLKQGGALVRTFRPLPSKPIINLSTVTFSYQRCFFAPSPRFKNLKPPLCYSLLAQKTTHNLTADDHRSVSRRHNIFKDNRPVSANPNFVSKLLSLLRKPATAAAVLGLLVMYKPYSAALAAPVGRVGRSLTSNTSTSYYPSENSSTRIKKYDKVDNLYCEPIWLWASMVFLVYFFGGCNIKILPLPKVWRATLFILWTVIMAIWFHSLGATSVVKLQLQVKLPDTARAVQMDLNRIAETAEPYSQDGLRYVLKDTAVALLRQPDHSISGYSSVVIPKFTIAAAQKCFDKLVLIERVRYESYNKETIVNVDNMESQSTASQRSTNDSDNDEVVVVTILLAAEGKHSKSLTITDSSDVKRVLEELGSIEISKRLLGVEVLWTPQLSSNAASK